MLRVIDVREFSCCRIRLSNLRYLGTHTVTRARECQLLSYAPSLFRVARGRRLSLQFCHAQPAGLPAAASVESRGCSRSARMLSDAWWSRWRSGQPSAVAFRERRSAPARGTEPRYAGGFRRQQREQQSYPVVHPPTEWSGCAATEFDLASPRHCSDDRGSAGTVRGDYPGSRL